jgi:hypothetical protein
MQAAKADGRAAHVVRPAREQLSNIFSIPILERQIFNPAKTGLVIRYERKVHIHRGRSYQ